MAPSADCTCIFTAKLHHVTQGLLPVVARGKLTNHRTRCKSQDDQSVAMTERDLILAILK